MGIVGLIRNKYIDNVSPLSEQLTKRIGPRSISYFECGGLVDGISV